jgi:hypothetical protein
MYGVAAPLALLLGVGMVRQAGFVCAPPRGGGGGATPRFGARAVHVPVCACEVEEGGAGVLESSIEGVTARGALLLKVGMVRPRTGTGRREGCF